MSGVAFMGFGATQSPLSEGAPLRVAKTDEAPLKGLAAAESIDKDFAMGFLLALEVDPEKIHKPKSLDFGYLDTDVVAAAISATQWPDGKPAKGKRYTRCT